MSRRILRLDQSPSAVKVPRDARDLRHAWKRVQDVAAAPGAEQELADILAPARTVRRYSGHRRQRFAA